MTSVDKPRSLAELKKSGYKVVGVREEMRRNLIRKIVAGEELFPGIIGYDDTVIPEVENAILAGQDIILLGERGQAKSRLIRALVGLLDEEIPYVAGCEVNDNPFAPSAAPATISWPRWGTKRPLHGCHAKRDTPRSWLLRTSPWRTS